MRMSRTAMLPVAFLFVCAVPLAFAAHWTPVFLLVPVLVALWVLRVGVDVADDGISALPRRPAPGPLGRAGRHPGGRARGPVAGHHPRYAGAAAGAAGPRPAEAGRALRRPHPRP